MLMAQSKTSLSGSLFQFATTTKQANFTDSEGSYEFLFGLDYNTTMTPGVPAIVDVLISLQSEAKSSSFLRGVSVQIVSSGVLIDGMEETGTRSMTTANSDLMTDRISNVYINDTSGEHSMSVRLIISIVHVNYIGYFSGNDQLVVVNGTISIV